MRIIKAATATETKSDTVFYAIKLQDALDYFSKSGKNCWIWAALYNNGFDNIDTEGKLIGSVDIDDVLYICDTDGEDIEVNGESVNPEEALNEFTPDELSEYVVEATDRDIRRFITEDAIVDVDYNKLAYDLLDNGYDFLTMVDDFSEFEYSF